MIVEHTFVTTQEWAGVLALTAEFLAAAGFQVSAFSDGHVEARRGGDEPRGGPVARLPQTLHVQFDRGRVVVAAGIRGTGDKDKPSFAPLLTALVQALEAVLAGGQSIDTALAAWRDWEAAAPRVTGAGVPVAIGCLIIAVVVIVIAVLAVSMGSH